MTDRLCSNAGTACRRHDNGSCLSRREMLLMSGAGAATILLGDLFGDTVFAQDAMRETTLVRYPRRKVASLASLVQDTPVPILYPGDDELYSGCIIIKLGRRAGGGVGPDQDVVAFSAYCSHMGASLHGHYNATYKVAGPCPQHLTTFDLTRHGLLVAGHATQSLPQLVLELDGDDIYAVGVIGLIYGNPSNLALVTPTVG